MQNLNIKHNSCHRVEIHVRGTVQGVGFRPFVFKLACRFNLGGTVSNSSGGVVILATGPREQLQLFIQALLQEAPPLADIVSLDNQFRELDSGRDQIKEPFSILPSVTGCSENTAIPPDIGLCDDCLRELLDPADRRFHYPFINCTNCGPRFSIVQTIPYDRAKTSMQSFPMCSVCEKEYHNPADRRFHAQPNACPDCGPTLSLHDQSGGRLTTKNPLLQTISALDEGQVLAIRGLGGFHLSVNGCSEEAVAKLRKRKGRPDKPLAIMVANLQMARKFCHINQEEEELLTCHRQPIVLLKKLEGTALATNLAPAVAEIGLMLPYTPLHHLLFQQKNCPEALVMTSGNRSGSPICTAGNQASEQLSSIADLFLMHNREIVTRVDDSVVRVVAGQPVILRRARGYAPSPIQVQQNLPQILACGPGLKNTFCLGRGNSIYPSQHMGDLVNLESYDFYQESIAHLKVLSQIEPEIVACDLHPDYLSSSYARETKLPLYRVQHHHAHAVAVMAEHGLEEPVLAIVLDGTGLGEDGTIWGGEILKTDLTGFERLGHLSQFKLPGGDMATTEPWRIALSALFETFGPDHLNLKNLPTSLRNLAPEKIEIISTMLQGGFNSPASSSCGRLFDAVASLIGLRHHISYEGQAAMELEALATKAAPSLWLENIFAAPTLNSENLLKLSRGKWEISSVEFVKRVVDQITLGVRPSLVALEFHGMLIKALTRLMEKLSQETGIRDIVLAGGCMQNSLLLAGLHLGLQSIQLNVFTGKLLPLNDGAISFGQTIIGGLRHVSCNTNAGNKRPG